MTANSESELKELNIESRKYLKKITRSIPDHPKAGIVFRDLTTIFQDPKAMAMSIDLIGAILKPADSADLRFDKIVGVEARGFVLAGALAGRIGGGVVLARKPGKLPSSKRRVAYKLEYGEDALEIHTDAIQKGERIIVVDDLLATGGTAEAACKLVEDLQGEIVKVIFLVELPDLKGRDRLSKYDVESVISFDGD